MLSDARNHRHIALRHVSLHVTFYAMFKKSGWRGGENMTLSVIRVNITNEAFTYVYSNDTYREAYFLLLCIHVASSFDLYFL